MIALKIHAVFEKSHQRLTNIINNQYLVLSYPVIKKVIVPPNFVILFSYFFILSLPYSSPRLFARPR